MCAWREIERGRKNQGEKGSEVGREEIGGVESIQLYFSGYLRDSHCIRDGRRKCPSSWAIPPTDRPSIFSVAITTRFLL